MYMVSAFGPPWFQLVMGHPLLLGSYSIPTSTMASTRAVCREYKLTSQFMLMLTRTNSVFITMNITLINEYSFIMNQPRIKHTIGSL